MGKIKDIRKKESKPFWNNLTVIFPNRDIINKTYEKNRTNSYRLKMLDSGIKGIFSFLLAQGENNLDNWECLEYQGHNLPFIGNRFLGPNDQSVRIAPVLPGSDMKSTYYIEFFPNIKAFDQINNSFDYIRKDSLPMTEWNIFGYLDNNDFYYEGIVNRKRLLSRGRCCPVVLVILYDGEENKVWLQERTFRNAVDGIGSLSNISGRIIDLDILVEKNISIKETIRYIDSDDDIAATKEFNKLTKLQRGFKPSEKVWKIAALRELRQELLLDIDDMERLKYHGTHYLPYEEPKCEINDQGLGCAKDDKIFKIFSLKLKRKIDNNEVNYLSQVPYIELKAYSSNDLRKHHNKFNTFLYREFENVFVPIFDKLNIN
jgi:hypothetical protein